MNRRLLLYLTLESERVGHVDERVALPPGHLDHAVGQLAEAFDGFCVTGIQFWWHELSVVQWSVVGSLAR